MYSHDRGGKHVVEIELKCGDKVQGKGVRKKQRGDIRGSDNLETDSIAKHIEDKSRKRR